MTSTGGALIPIPRGDGVTVVAPPGSGPGFWAGGPSAVATADGIYLAYRLRRPVDAGRGYAMVVAHSDDGVAFTPLVTLEKETFATASFERPALVARPEGGWRLYVSCSTPNSKHWWVDAIDADTPSRFTADGRVTVWPGDADTAVKDPVVSVRDEHWEAWVCCHPLDDPHETDRMTSRYATSADGLTWDWGPVALRPRTHLDARGHPHRGSAHRSRGPRRLLHGRASVAENWNERTGIAVAGPGGEFVPVGYAAAAVSPQGAGALRYVSVVAVAGGYRLYYEASRADGAHELRTELVHTTG